MKPALRWLAAAALTAIALHLVFGDARHFGFAGYDDREYYFRNPHLLEGGVADRVRWAFTAFHAGNWHPLTWLSFAADEALFGLAPGPLHAENILLHGVNTLLLLGLLVRATGSFARSALVVALFALHPLRVESVVWVTERKGLLMALFGLLTLHAHLSRARRPSRRGDLLVVALFVATLLAKPQAAALPAALLLFDWWPLGRFGPGVTRERRRAALFALVPLLLAAGAVTPLVVSAQRQAGAVAPLYALPLASRLAPAVVAPAAYLDKTLAPRGLAPLYPFARPPGPAVAGAILLLGAVTFACFALRARHPWLPFGWLGFLALLAPVSNLLQVGGAATADRYTYLPHIPLLTGAVWAGAEALRRAPPARRRLVACAAGLLVCTLASAARWQTAVWRNDLTLFSHAVAVTTGNWKMHYNLGNTLERIGRDREAEREYGLALVTWPAYPAALNNLGALYGRRGQTVAAKGMFLRAVSADPGHVSAWVNLGHLYDQQGSPREAVEAYRRAVALLPGAAEPRARLGRALLQLGRRDEALGWCRSAADLESGSEAAAACLREAARPQ